MKNTLLHEASRLTRAGDKFIQKSGPQKFYEEAAALLDKASMHKHFSFEDLVIGSFGKNFNHEQNFKSLEFSDLPVTIARGEHSFVDLYFWRRRPTTIHNHHFTGAFQCLHGSNVELKYKFTKERRLTRFHTMGELKEIKETKVLPGDIECIDLQDKFIHQSHHQADLTVNLCFRTPDFKGKNLANFFYPGLKYEKNALTLQKAQRLYAFALIEDFKLDKVDVAPEVALTFLIETLNMGSSHPAVKKLQNNFMRKFKSESKLDLAKLFQTHENYLDHLIEKYA